MINEKEELIRQIREVGESLIKNAESIAGYEDIFAGLKIVADFNPQEATPVITLNRLFYPEKTIERKS